MLFYTNSLKCIVSGLHVLGISGLSWNVCHYVVEETGISFLIEADASCSYDLTKQVIIVISVSLVNF